MRTIDRSTRFKRDYKRESKGRHRATLDADLLPVLAALATDTPLDPKYRDHDLSGDWAGYRDCHVKPDLVQGFLFGSALTASGIETMSSTVWPFGDEIETARRVVSR